MALLRQQVEGIDLAVALEHLADVPCHALVDHPFADTKRVANLQGALGKADGAGTFGDLVVVVEQHHRVSALSKVDGGRQADGARADNDEGMMRR